LRVVENLVGETGFHHPRTAHDHQAVGEQARHRQVVGDDHHRQVQLAHQAAQQVEQARLHRHVEAAGGVVHEHQARRRDQVAGDLQALLHAAGKGSRQVVDAQRIDLHLFQPVQPGLAQPTVVAHALGHQPFADVGAGGHAHA
ncbi:hypothetical protein UF31_20855, partial [Vibrio parahaemolyticus]